MAVPYQEHDTSHLLIHANPHRKNNFTVDIKDVHFSDPELSLVNHKQHQSITK